MQDSNGPDLGRNLHRRLHASQLPQIFSSGVARSAASGATIVAEAPATGKRVLLAGRIDAFTAPGGGETQMQATAAALRQQGVDARMWRPWEENFDGVQCLHLFGSVPEHLQLVAAARRARIPVVLSTIAWFDFASRWHASGSRWSRWGACAKLLARRAFRRLPHWRKRLYDQVDLLLPNSQVEAEQLIRYFRVSRRRIHVVPNGAEERFAGVSGATFARLVGGRGFILYPGRIEPRKNQLGFLRAMRDCRTPIVILGDAAPGHDDYWQACRSVAGEHVMFVPQLRHDDPLLASAYVACGCLALASWFETPGLVALEAGMTGTSLVLPQHGAAPEYFGNLALYVDPRKPAEIRQQVQAALERPRSFELSHLVRTRYSWRAAAQATELAYARVA